MQFRRAIERGNALIAEVTAREFALTLEEALQLVRVTLLQAQIALVALADLRLGGDAAASTLAGLIDKSEVAA